MLDPRMSPGKADCCLTTHLFALEPGLVSRAVEHETIICNLMAELHRCDNSTGRKGIYVVDDEILACARHR